MNVTDHDKQLTETMMREFLDIGFTIDGESGDVVDHVQRFKNQLRDQVTDVLKQSFDYINENAKEEAEKRGADDPQDVRLALLANMPMAVTSIVADMALTDMLTLGLGGVTAVGRGQLTHDDAQELLDEMLSDIVRHAQASASKKMESMLGQVDAAMTTLEALKRAANQ